MQNEPASPPPKTPLRWYQYRLRTLLIIMTVFAAWMAWVSHHARQQKLAVEQIRLLGGTVHYDYQAIPVTPAEREYGLEFDFDEKITPPGPQWLRKFIGDDYFQTVVSVGLSKTSVTDDDLMIMENLPYLEELILDETKISGKGLGQLEGLKNLISLSMGNTLIDDSGLAYLRNFTTLRSLYLDGKNITDGSLKYLKNIKKLETLMLIDTQITKKGEASLKKDLPNTNIIYGTSYWE